jgi:hypothetical protein
MKTQKKALLLSVLMFGCLFFSCEKEVDKKAGCKISSMTETGPGTYSRTHTLAYNNDGQLSTLNSTGTGGNTSKIFIYSGNTILVNTTNTSSSGTSTYRDSITIDDQKRPLNVRQYFQNGTTWINIRFEYNGERLARAHRTTESSATADITTCTYDNSGNNVVRFESSVQTEILEYYDEEVQPADWLETLTLITYGVSVYPHKNLIKSYNNGTTIGNFSYVKNADGLITQTTTTTATSVSTITYQYECD